MSDRRAVFLDRDGVINPLIYHKDAGIVDSPFTLKQFNVFPWVPRAIRNLNDKGFAVIIISNQPGIAKGHFTAAVLQGFDRKLQAALKPAKARLDAAYYCLHHPEAVVKSLRKRCSCRKPGTGMLLQAARDLGISLSESYMTDSCSARLLVDECATGQVKLAEQLYRRGVIEIARETLLLGASPPPEH